MCCLSNGWTSGVALSTTSATSGITASLSTSPVAVNGTSTLTVSVASSVPPGAYSVVVNGMSGSQAGQNNHSISIPITVTGGGGTPDFTLSASPASVSVAAPGSGTTTIMVNPLNGFSGSVALSASGLPSGVTAGFSPASTTTTSLLTLTADGTAVAGTYPVTVTGGSGSLTHTVAVNVMVTTGGGGGNGYGDFYMAAYATSSSSIRVYWHSVPDAVQYLVFRTNTPGGYGNQPIATLSNTTLRFDDNGLQPVAYFYIVKAVKAGGTVLTSDEDGDVPSGSAIPWNGTPSQILQGAWNAAGEVSTPPTDDGSTYNPDLINLRVMAPDGHMYYFDESGNPVDSVTPDATYDSSTGDVLYSNGSVAATTSLVEPDDSVGSGNPTGGILQLNWFNAHSVGASLSSFFGSNTAYRFRQGGDPNSTGVVRRVATHLLDPTTARSYRGVGAIFHLPLFGGSGSVPTGSNGHVTPHAYIGIIHDPNHNEELKTELT